MNEYSIIEKFISDSDNLALDGNLLERTALCTKLISKYQTPILHIINDLATRLSNIEKKYKNTKKALKKESMPEKKVDIIPAVKPVKIKVNLFGKTFMLAKHNGITLHESMTYCPVKKLVIFKMFDSTFYFSPPQEEATNKRIVDCTSERCTVIPQADCGYYHRPEHYNRFIAPKNYMKLYLPKPLTSISYEKIVNLISHNRGFTSTEIDTLKDYISYLVMIYLIMTKKLN